MTHPDDDRPVDTVGRNQRRRIESRREEASPFEDMQDKLRKSGARRNADGSYQTNEGTVVLESPTEANRRAIFAESAKTRRNYFGHKGRDPATEQMARILAKDTELDIDWGDYAPVPEERPMLSGQCCGGPYDGLNASHPETVMPVVLDRLSLRPLVGQVGPSVVNPDLVWFSYVWEPTDRSWRWDDSPGQASGT